MEKELLHIGQMIEKKVNEKGISNADLAKLLACSRPNINNIYTRQSVDTQLLSKISRILDFDFLREISNINFEHNNETFCLSINITANEINQEMICKIKELLETINKSGY